MTTLIDRHPIPDLRAVTYWSAFAGAEVVPVQVELGGEGFTVCLNWSGEVVSAFTWGADEESWVSGS